MQTLKFIGAILIASLIFGVSASEIATPVVQTVTQPVQPIGYFVETVSNTDADSAKAHATFTRDGETFPAESGMEVFPGDIVSTPAAGGILIAFVNNNTFQLHGESQATIHNVGELSTPNSAQITLNSGRAFANVRTPSENGFQVDIGDTKSPMARAAAPKPASLEIVVTNSGGVYTSNVAVLTGSVLLTPRTGGSPTDVSANGQALITLNTTTKPVSGTVVAGNIDKATLANLKKGIPIPLFSDTIIKVGKGGTSNITSTIHNSDGSISKGKISTVNNGMVSKDSWKTTGPNKFSESWSETISATTGSKISVKQSYKGVSISASFSGPKDTVLTTPKATIKDSANKQTYTGTASFDPATGIITFVTTKAGKDGSTATYQFNPNGVGGATLKTVVTGGTGAGTIQTVVPVGAPAATTPDGRGVTQNQPPKSQ